MALVSLALYFSTQVTMSEQATRRGRHWIEMSMSIVGQNAADLFERSGPAVLAQYINRVNRRPRLNVSFLNKHGEILAGPPLPEGARNIVMQAIQTGQIQTQFSESQQWVAQAVISQNAQKFVVFGENIGRIRRMPPARRRAPMALLKVLGVWDVGLSAHALRLLTVFLTAGVVCYGLARYLTAPLVKLRLATQKLAGGDLAARVGSKRNDRQDELTALGQDFDLMAEQVQNIVEAQRRLLSDISHELRSPLARLNVALGLIRQREVGDIGQELSRIKLEADRLNNLISHLLTLTRMESGSGDIPYEEIHLSELLSEVLNDAKFEASSLDREVRIVASDSCVVVGNQELLRSAIENVVRNAIYYTADKTEVEIELRLKRIPEVWAIIKIRDHGEGVRESELTELFRPFYRVAEARERQTGGTGLGLAITDRSVRLHGGSVAAFNEPEGGLTIEIRLPAKSDRGEHFPGG